MPRCTKCGHSFSLEKRDVQDLSLTSETKFPDLVDELAAKLKCPLCGGTVELGERDRRTLRLLLPLPEKKEAQPEETSQTSGKDKEMEDD